MKFLNSKQKKNLIKELEIIYGVAELNYQFIEAGKKRLRAFSGSLNGDEISELSMLTKIETIGMYFISQKDAEPRINFDALPLLKSRITKNIFQIDRAQLEKWIRGYDLDLKAKRGTIVLKFEDELVGIGKSNGEKIFNYLPKERKLKIPL